RSRWLQPAEKTGFSKSFEITSFYKNSASPRLCVKKAPLRLYTCVSALMCTAFIWAHFLYIMLISYND
ncbi:MAG: hypothetical protein J5746_01070, partial [Victivallales bacterium]|nr:hypothetical protein [Victivallales bacterium]